MKGVRGKLGDSSEPVWDPPGRGRPRGLPLCAPLRSLRSLPSHPSSPPPPSGSPPGSGRSPTARPPRRPARRYSAQPSPSPSSPGEDRRRPAFLLSIFSSRGCSRSCSGCHLKTPPLGEGRRRGGRGGNRKVATALAQEWACALRPEVIRASHLHPEVTSGTVFFARFVLFVFCFLFLLLGGWGRGIVFFGVIF